mmetsp:Transcript_55023/g.118891  ORF Transcript_55023/g.118891 Transcript_55023/m.118891 type:complete len:217 (+) Transcript_55023:280-930(+)
MYRRVADFELRARFPPELGTIAAVRVAGIHDGALEATESIGQPGGESLDCLLHAAPGDAHEFALGRAACGIDVRRWLRLIPGVIRDPQAGLAEVCGGIQSSAAHVAVPARPAAFDKLPGFSPPLLDDASGCVFALVRPAEALNCCPQKLSHVPARFHHMATVPCRQHPSDMDGACCVVPRDLETRDVEDALVLSAVRCVRRALVVKALVHRDPHRT